MLQLSWRQWSTPRPLKLIGVRCSWIDPCMIWASSRAKSWSQSICLGHIDFVRWLKTCFFSKAGVPKMPSFWAFSMVSPNLGWTPCHPFGFKTRNPGPSFVTSGMTAWHREHLKIRIPVTKSYGTQMSLATVYPISFLLYIYITVYIVYMYIYIYPTRILLFYMISRA